eukprot:SAG31_NODE_14965_length_778_cov_0.917526_3_plen_72_part_01
MNRAVAAATSDEVRAAANEAQNGLGGGSLACFDPVINICRDVRWGKLSSESVAVLRRCVLNICCAQGDVRKA